MCLRAHVGHLGAAGRGPVEEAQGDRWCIFSKELIEICKYLKKPV